MKLKVNVIMIFLVLTGFITINSQSQRRVDIKKKINKITSSTKLPIEKSVHNHQTTASIIKFTSTIKPQLQLNSSKINTTKLLDFKTATSLDNSLELRHRPGKKNKQWNNTLMALLLAYKLKFAALIPTLIGGLILLLSTTAMAGFFFALFAAILGLKGS